jgi:hypothetical protein
MAILSALFVAQVESRVKSSGTKPKGSPFRASSSGLSVQIARLVGLKGSSHGYKTCNLVWNRIVLAEHYAKL